MDGYDTQTILIQMSGQLGELTATIKSANQNLNGLKEEIKDNKIAMTKVLEDHGLRLEGLEDSKKKIVYGTAGASGVVSALGLALHWLIK